eukprot:Protomagalhaensia_sp_Gyna_25__3172@NODE_289_length_4038_cov_191_170293_g223_i0_p1_GENE_NODE_289_length_4038_cov_191_170293_g223_i0NODE_289_length_4038_cov_191_170293_g223_i0_p1_ORF_typecomplete_len397_score54_85_NODE_289_length_4038_cov_191_170293_g223_i013152505
MRMSKPWLAVDDSLLPSSYAQVGRDLKALRETQWLGEYPLQHVAQLGAAPSFASNATTPRRVKPACCKACRDCREAWRHAHTHIDPWEIEVVSTSTSGGPDPPAALQAAWQQTRSRRLSSRQVEEENDEDEEESDQDLDSSDEEDTSLVAISEAALFGELVEHRSPTSGNSDQTLRSLVGASAPPAVHMLLQQVLAPLMDFCRRVPEPKKKHSVCNAPVVPSSDPYESLTSAVPNSASTSSRPGRLTRDVSVPRLRHASRTPPPRKRAAERSLPRRDAEDDSRGRVDMIKSAVAVSAALPPVSMERRRNEQPISFPLQSVERMASSAATFSSRPTTSSAATEGHSSGDVLTDSTLPSRVSEFEIITEAICANHDQYLKHTSRTAWPWRDARGRQSR